MAKNHEASVTRRYSLPVDQLDHLRQARRRYQNEMRQIDPACRLSNSLALTWIIADHQDFTEIAADLGLDVSGLIAALRLEGPRLLKADLASTGQSDAIPTAVSGNEA